MIRALRRLNKVSKRRWLVALSLLILLLIWPTASRGTPNESAPPSVVAMQQLVPVRLLEESRDLIDQLEYEVALCDSMHAASQARWAEVVQAMEQENQTLRRIIADLEKQQSPDLFDHLLWGALGYGLRAATE